MKRKREIWKSKEVCSIIDGGWINHYDRRSCCLRERMNGRKTINHIDQTWQYDQLQVGTCVPTVLPRGIVDTSPRSDADAASVDREEDLPDSLQPFTDGLIERESGSSGSAGETIPKTLAPHIPAGRWNNSGGTHNLFTHFPRDPLLHCDFCKRTKIAKAPCRRNLESREDRKPQAAQVRAFNHSGSHSSQ